LAELAISSFGHRCLRGIGEDLEPVADGPDRVDEIVAHPRAEHGRKVGRRELDKVRHGKGLLKNQLG
jgi:hypothetical protein